MGLRIDALCLDRRDINHPGRQQAGLKYLLLQLLHDPLRGDALTHHERALSIATNLHGSKLRVLIRGKLACSVDGQLEITSALPGPLRRLFFARCLVQLVPGFCDASRIHFSKEIAPAKLCLRLVVAIVEAFQKALHPLFSFSVIPAGWALLTDDVLYVPRLRDFVTVQPQPARCLRDRPKDFLCFVSIAVRTCRDEIIIIVPAPVLRRFEMVNAHAASPSFIGGASVVTAVNALEAITEHYPVGCFAWQRHLRPLWGHQAGIPR